MVKSQIRRHFRELRSQFSIAYRESAAIAAAYHFTQQEMFKRSKHIACYLHCKDEFDSSPIIEAIWQAKKYCYLPTLTEDHTLRFVCYNNGDALRLNRYSILEPANAAPDYPSQDLEIVITPLVAFDLHGHRLGAGGGYYDRTFAFLHHHPHKKPLIIGWAYAAQQAELLPFDEWDIGLDGVVTEKEFILFSGSRV